MADGSSSPSRTQGTPANYGNVPVIFSAVLAAVAGVAVAVFSTGGTERQFRWELGVAAACATFIVSLLIFLLLIVTARPNPEELGQGTGIKKSFGSLPEAPDGEEGFRADGTDRR